MEYLAVFTLPDLLPEVVTFLKRKDPELLPLKWKWGFRVIKSLRLIRLTNIMQPLLSVVDHS